MALRRFVIERELPAIGSAEREALKEAAKTSNAALAKLGPSIQWVESYVAADKTFCVYLAENEDVIRQHAQISGFPANKITEIRRTIDPTHGERLVTRRFSARADRRWIWRRSRARPAPRRCAGLFPAAPNAAPTACATA